MKKINLIGYLSMALIIFFTSCTSEEDLNIDLETNKSTFVEIDEETAFGFSEWYGSDCFDQAGFNRWGWTVGPFTDVISFGLWAGAGQCDTSKGVKVGRVTVRYNPISKYGFVKYNMFEGYTLLEAHAYVGTDMYPTNKKGKPTVAPGQYPYKNSNLEIGATEHVFQIYDLPVSDNGLYAITHAVVTSK